MSKPNVLAIIPARYASTRFPGKPLVPIHGKPMIEHVYKRAQQAHLLSGVMVATDDERIAAAVSAFKGQFVMTGANHQSGTDRLAEVARSRKDIDIIVNVQGDEPLIDPAAVDAAIQPLLSDSSVQMSTLAAPIIDASDAQKPSIVKVVTDRAGFALYFSRCAIPFYRDQPAQQAQRYLGHVGLYVYRREALLKLASMPPSPLELAESLEQLRALENGIRIKVVETNYRSLAIDVPEDLSIVESAMSAPAATN